MLCDNKNNKATTFRINKTDKQMRFAALLFCTSILATACSAANEPPTIAVATPTISEKMQTVDNQITGMATNISCKVASDCAFLSIGERACGGPSSYKIYSKQIGEEAIKKLHALAAESTTLARKANKDNGLASTCEFYPLPSLSCIENQCVQNESQHPIY